MVYIAREHTFCRRTGTEHILCIVLIYLTVGGDLLKQLTAENFTKRSPGLLLLQDCIFIGTTARQLGYRICYTLPGSMSALGCPRKPAPADETTSLDYTEAPNF
jgi:hypothetical protein